MAEYTFITFLGDEGGSRPTTRPRRYCARLGWRSCSAVPDRHQYVATEADFRWLLR
jgi:hypothetical protein